MQLDSLDDWILYIERNPLVILFLVLASWLFSLWNRRQLDIYSYESSPESRGYPPIEPLPDFNWETAEPLCFRPFKPKYHLTMALSSLDPSTLIPMDKTYKDRLALRADLLRQHPDVIIAINSPEDPHVLAAINELYTFVVGSYLPTRYPRMFRVTQTAEKHTVLHSLVTGQHAPLDWTATPQNGRQQLEILGSLVDEDFLILLPESSPSSQSQDPNSQSTTDQKEETEETEPKYVLRAYTAYFPSGFNPAEKIGLRLANIHAPVPGYKEKLERSMDRFFARVEVGKFVQRVNWSVTTDTDLFAAFGGVHGSEGEGGVIEEEGGLDVDSTLLRCERQTLHRLPRSKALVFAFHTYTYPIQSVKDEGLGEDLAGAIDGLKEGNVPEMHWYKRAPVWGDAVKRFLRS